MSLFRPSVRQSVLLVHILTEDGHVWHNNYTLSVNFVTIFGDKYQIKLYGTSNYFNQFTHLRFVSGVNRDVTKLAAIAPLISIYVMILRYVSKTKFL